MVAIINKSKLLGVTYVVIASMAFGSVGIFVKLARLENTPLDSILLFSYLTSAIAAGFVGRLSGQSFKITRRQGLHIAVFGSIAFYFTGYFMGLSYDYIPVGLAYMLHFSYPVIVTVFMTAVFREKVTFIKILALAVAFIGIALLADFKGGISPIGVVLALATGFTYASYIIAGKKSAFKDLNGIIIVFYLNVFSSVLLMVLQLFRGPVILPPSAIAWLFVVLSGMAGNVFALTMLTIAIKILGSTRTAILNMLEPIVAVILGVIIFNEQLTLIAAGGCVMVVVSAILVTMESG